MKKNRKINQLLGAVCAFLLAILLMPLKAQAEGVLDQYGSAKIYNVLDYGVSNAGKDSGSAMDALIVQIRRDVYKGNLDGKNSMVLYFPGGTYDLTSLKYRLQVQSNMMIVAEQDAVIKCGPEGCFKFVNVENSGASGGTWIGGETGTIFHCNGDSRRNKNLSFSNLKIQGGRYGIKWSNAEGVMENLVVTGCESIGISLTKKSNVVMNKCKLDNNGYSYPAPDCYGQGMGVYTGSSAVIKNSQMINNRECGISLTTANVTMTNCKIQKNGRHGVGTDGKCKLVMKKCDIYRNGQRDKMDGVSLVEGSQGTFTDCKFRSNKVTGLHLNNNGTKATVKGCTFKGNGTQNIYAETTSGNTRLVVDSCKFYKTKTAHNIRFYAKKKSACKLTLKGKNKYYKLKHKVTYTIGKKETYKN